MLPAEIDDESLIAAIPGSTLGESRKLVAEAGRRRLATAVPALAALCFTGFGARRLVPEQIAAIEALTIIGGREAADAVSEMIERAVVEGRDCRSRQARLRTSGLFYRRALCASCCDTPSRASGLMRVAAPVHCRS